MPGYTGPYPPITGNDPFLLQRRIYLWLLIILETAKHLTLADRAAIEHGIQIGENFSQMLAS